MVSAANSPETTACIAWDAAGTPDIIISTYGDAINNNLHEEFTGDGTKILRINLSNDHTESVYIGGYWEGQLLDV